MNRQFTEEQIQMAINMQRSSLQVIGKGNVKVTVNVLYHLISKNPEE